MDVSDNKKIIFSPPVFQQRLHKVLSILTDFRWRKKLNKLVDLGCSSYNLFHVIKDLSDLKEVAFVDINEDVLRRHIGVLTPDTSKVLKRRRPSLFINVFTGSVIHPDKRLLETDVVTAIELIEHLYPDELDAFPYNVFGFIAPKLVIITTPNADFNVAFGDDPKRLRNRDHKFEWTRSEFEDWSRNITERYPNYRVYFSGVGKHQDYSPKYGPSTQIALFIRKDLLGEEVIDDVVKCRCKEKGFCPFVNPKSNKLFCKCVCRTCCPKTSYGVCQYYPRSRYKNKNMFREQPGDNSLGYYYKFVKCLSYPETDDRTEEEEMLEKFEKYIIEEIRPKGKYFNKDKDRFEIPLCQILKAPAVDDGNSISVRQFKYMLMKYDHHVEDLYWYSARKVHPHLIQSKSAADIKQLEPIIRKPIIVPG